MMKFTKAAPAMPIGGVTHDCKKQPAATQKLLQYAVLSILCFLLTQVGNAQTVTLNLTKATIQQVLAETSRQSGISIVYNEAIFAKFEPVTINVKNASVGDVLSKCFKNLPYTYAVEGKSIIIKQVPPTPANVPPARAADVATVAGIVLGEKGEPLVGATVVINEPYKKGTFTDSEGRFSLADIPNGKNSLQISSVGYEKMTKVVTAGKGITTVSITLKEAIAVSEEVVVNGLFSRPKENFTGSATSFTGDQLREISSTNILTALKSMDASIQVPTDNVNGSNPNVLPRLQVRGSNSIMQTDLTSEYGYISNPPLIILNGFEITLQQFVDMDINIIEKITILKDASATAIYGSRSANGVIVIETKRPKPGKLQVTYNGNLTMNMPDLSSYNLMNASEKMRYEQVAGLYKSRNFTTQANLDTRYNQVMQNVQRGVNTYWLSQPLQTELNHTHTVILGGGTRNLLYSGQLNYGKNGGIMKGSNRDNMSGNLSLTYQVAKFKLMGQFLIGNTSSNNTPYGSFDAYARLNPYWSITDGDGKISRYVDQYYTTNVNGVPVSLPNAYQPSEINPMYNTTLNTVDKSSTLSLGQNIWAELELFRGLKLNATFSVNSIKGEDNRFLPGAASQFFGYSDFSKRGSFEKNTTSATEYQSNILLNYGRTFGKHTIFATGGTNIMQSTRQNMNILVTGFGSQRLDDILFGLNYGNNKPTGDYEKKRTVGYLSNVSYAYDNRYLVDLSYRSDGSSVFGENKRFGSFWSAGAGWNLHHEKFLHLPSYISKLKLKASYGFTGAVNFPGYASTTTYQYQTNGRYLDFIPATIMALGNPELLWQRTKKFNTGADIALFKDRVNIAFDYYEEATDNLIMQNPSPASTGFNSYFNNMGKSVNKGYSLSLFAFIIKKPAQKLYWSMGTSWFANKNKLVSITDVLTQQNQKALDTIANGYTKPVLQYVEGNSVSTLYAVRSLGIDPANGREIYLTKDGKQTYIWNAKDMVAMGDMQPKFNATITNNFQYKWIKLNFALNIVLGGVKYNNTLADKYENANKAYNVDKRALDDRWIKPGDVAQYKGLTDLEGYPLQTTATNATSRFVRKNNSINITGISIDPGKLLSQYLTKYTNLAIEKLNNKAKDVIKTDMIDMRFVMNNVFTNLFGSKREEGTAYPLNRTYSLNLILHL